MDLNELLNEITRKLQGHVAVVQIFVDGEVHVLLKRAMKKLHVRKKLSMHCGRVTCATICLLRGVPLSTIQHVLGHKSINTTASVYAQVLDNTISRTMRRAWRA